MPQSVTYLETGSLKMWLNWNEVLKVGPNLLQCSCNKRKLVHKHAQKEDKMKTEKRQPTGSETEKPPKKPPS